MAKGELNKESAIKSILSDLKKGIDKKTILQQVAQKCNKDRTTLHRWFAEAEKQYKPIEERLKPIKEKAEEEAVFEATKEAVKSGILSELERKQYLSSWIKGEVKVIKTTTTEQGVFVTESEPTIAERKAALAELNKMEGNYAPTKTDITSGGENLKPPTFHIILDNGE